MTEREKTVIIGPCAAESREQVLDSARQIKERGYKIMRSSLWKPRTRPGYFGVGSEGTAWFAEVTNMGITIGTEVMLPQHVSDVINGVDKNGGDPRNILLWLGSRNQNQFIQSEIARRTQEEAPENVKILIKNQPWADEKHWLGIVDHVASAGISPSRIILCHRGFYPNGDPNPDKFRNIPNFEMAMRIKEKTKLPMILDPSHIGGSVENVFKTVKLASDYDFDGMMIEVHPNPKNAETDKDQQLSFSQLDSLLSI